MAYVTFQKEFWSDDYILRLNTTQKLVYLYIITNEKTTQCGIYELPIIKATTELCISAEEFLINLKKFNDDKKIEYSIETQEVCIINWLKHNENSSWKTMERIRKELLKIKNPNLIVLLYDPRKPLYDGPRKKKIGNNYVEERYIIENPWNGVFKDITDEILAEIRKPYKKQASLMPLLSPFDAPSMGHLPYTLHNKDITNSLHNKDITETNTETETIQDPPPVSSIPFDSYPGEKKETPKDPLSSQITKAIEIWNGFENLPRCKYSILNLPNIGEVRTKFDVFGPEEISEAIQNLSRFIQYENFKPTSFDRFIINSLDRWISSCKPWERYEDHRIKSDTEKELAKVEEYISIVEGSMPEEHISTYRKKANDLKAIVEKEKMKGAAYA